MGRDLERKEGIAPFGKFKKAVKLGLNPADRENKHIYILIHFQVTKCMLK